MIKKVEGNEKQRSRLKGDCKNTGQNTVHTLNLVMKNDQTDPNERAFYKIIRLYSSEVLRF